MNNARVGLINGFLKGKFFMFWASQQFAGKFGKRGIKRALTRRLSKARWK